MAAPTLITVDNYDSLLVESTNPAGSSPDGNVYFDYDNDEIQLIGLDELATVDLGSGAEANPLTNTTGIQLQALYAFERQQRRSNNSLRQFRPATSGTFKYAGAFQFINGRTLRAADRAKVRGSGWIERATDDSITRIYFGVRSLNNIEPTSQPFYQLAVSTSESDLQAAAPTDFGRAGPIDEAIQVFGDASNGNFDYTGRVLVVSVRTFGETFGRTTSTATGVSELNGFSTGFGIGESGNDANDYDLADVFGGASVTPWDTMTFTHYASPQSRSGFTSGSHDFSDIIANPDSGSLQQVRAFMDALMLQDTDQDAGAGSFIPKRAEPLYTIDAQGRVVTRQGLHIDNLPEADRQSIVQTDDSGAGRTYPFNVDVRIRVSSAWANDANGWYQAFIADGAAAADFDTANAVTLDDADGVDVVGTSADAVDLGGGTYEIRFSYGYSTNTQAGLSAGVDRDIIFLAEGDGGATAALAEVTITENAIVTGSAEAPAETNQ